MGFMFKVLNHVKKQTLNGNFLYVKKYMYKLIIEKKCSKVDKMHTIKTKRKASK